MNRLPIRHRLLLVVVLAVGSALALLIVGFNLLLAHNLAGDANRLARARVSAELGVLALKHGQLVVSESPDDAAPDTFAWVFTHGTTIESPAASPTVAAAARKLAAQAPASADVPGRAVRLYASPAVVASKRYGAVVAGVSLKPYDQTRRTALIASLALGGTVLLLVAVAARWLLASSLRPVARMTRLAADWSEHDLDRRFAAGEPRDELTELASTLDGLLDRLAASLRREQLFSAELSHELRTPLARVIAETELALRRPRTNDQYHSALELVHANAVQLARTTDTLLAAARHKLNGPRGTADALAVATAAAQTCSTLAAERDLAIRVTPPVHPIRLGVEADFAERVLQPLVENACRYAESRVELGVTRNGDGVVYTVTDDGVGIDETERELIFQPGARGRDRRTNGDGAGLGLALARRLARSVTGDVDSEAGPGGRFVVRLPGG
jgi:signal transduction histidine kinase